MPESVYSPAHEHLVQTLRDAREQAGLKQEDLARRIGRERWLISAIETGQRRVGVLEFHAIAVALGVDPLDLYQRAMLGDDGLTDSMSSPAPALPDTAPELYEDRADRNESPVDFLNRVWGQWLARRRLFQDQLRKLDPKLIPAIKSYCQARKIDAKAVLPPPKAVRLQGLARAARRAKRA